MMSKPTPALKLKKPDADRSRIMAAVKGRDTKPELFVRSLAHRMGYRFSLTRRDLPGDPDLAFVSRKAAVFVHGCFWHGHDCPRGSREPKTNRDYWLPKIARNRTRDARVIRELRKLGWRSLVVWECQLRDEAKLTRRLWAFVEK